MNELPSSLKLNKYEKLIIDARCNGSNTVLTDETFLHQFDILAFKISILTGIEIDSTEISLNAFKSLLIEFFEKYNLTQLNKEEILLAMEFNLIGWVAISKDLELYDIPFNEKFLNIRFIAKVLQNYFRVRQFLDKKIINSILGY